VLGEHFVKQFPRICICFVLLVFASCRQAPAPGQVEIVRDSWGIAHVFADSEVAAFWGAGFAAAEDRLFQMMLKRRQAQGRLAEIMGAGANERFLSSDRLVRTLGLYRAAIREVSVLPARERTGCSRNQSSDWSIDRVLIFSAESF
jgi:acyl-homoserine lactone acylase PvdQ